MPLAPTASPTAPCAAGVDATIHEHYKLMCMLDGLLAAAERVPADAGAWRSDIAELLGGLAPLLAMHFSQEESSPFCLELPLRSPRLADAIARLTAEHPTILQTLDELVQPPASMPAAELGRRVMRLVSHLRRHEAEETEILVHGAWDDIGLGE